MPRFLLALTAAAALAGVAHAQMREPPELDADHDGKVTLAEFMAAENVRIDRMFARFDLNHDGQITRQEMDAAVADRGGERGRRGGGPARFFDRLDTNHDGVLTHAELVAGAQARFAAADLDHDGWLSPDELQMMRPIRDRGGR